LGQIGSINEYDDFDHNVTKDFNSWFLIGTLVYVTVITGIGIEGIATFTKQASLRHLGNFITGWAQAFGGLIWILYGFVVRFRTTGEICSGHGLYNSTPSDRDKQANTVSYNGFCAAYPAEKDGFPVDPDDLEDGCYFKDSADVNNYIHGVLHRAGNFMKFYLISAIAVGSMCIFAGTFAAILSRNVSRHVK
jgi:hypothetical protein